MALLTQHNELPAGVTRHYLSNPAAENTCVLRRAEATGTLVQFLAPNGSAVTIGQVRSYSMSPRLSLSRHVRKVMEQTPGSTRVRCLQRTQHPAANAAAGLHIRILQWSRGLR